MKRLAIVLLALSSFGAHGFAQSPDVDAELTRLFELRRDGNDEAARDGFLALWEASSDPRALAQLGLAEHGLGRHWEAAEHLWEALAMDHEWIVRNREQIELVLRQSEAFVGRVDVRGPEGTLIRINGHDHGRLPVRSRAVEPGMVQIEAVYEEGSSFTRERVVSAAETWSLDVPEPPRDDPDPGLLDPAPEPSRVGPLVGLISGGALTLAGVTSLIIGNAFINDVEASEMGESWINVRGKAKRGENLSLAGFVTMGVGVAVITASVIWWLMTGGDEDDEAARWLGRFRF